MRTTRRRRGLRRQIPTTAVLALALALGAPPARADDAAGPRPFPPRGAGGPGARPGGAPARAEGGTGGWWLGTAGVALALAACGWAGVAARRYAPQARTGPSPLRVVGRTSLSPRHSVYLLDAGGRVLIVGTGPQGAPSLLGELTEPAAPARPSPRFDTIAGDES